MFAAGIVLQVLGLAVIYHTKLFDSVESPVKGQIFRLDLEGHIQKASGATVHVFRMPEGSHLEVNAEVRRFLEQHREAKWGSPERETDWGWSRVAGSLQSQYAETPEGIDPQLISDDVYVISDNLNLQYTPQEFARVIRQKYAKAYDDVPDEKLIRAMIEKYPEYKGRVRWDSLQDEWGHIKAKPEFVKLPESKKRLVKNAFWVRRVVANPDPSIEQQRVKLWLAVFQDEIAKGLLPSKQDTRFLSEEWAVEERLEKGAVVENADPDGHFSLGLKRGQYLLIVEGSVPAPEYSPVLGKSYNLKSAVWVKTIQVPRENGIVMAEPFCEP